MKFVRFESGSEEETRALGHRLASILPSSGVVSLVGNLGAGKTTITKGIVEGRGIASADDVSSPTFTLIHEYGDPPSIYHVDLYRLDKEEEAAGIGLDEIFESQALVLVEWGEKFRRLLPPNCWEIKITQNGKDRRTIELYQPEPPHPR